MTRRRPLAAASAVLLALAALVGCASPTAQVVRGSSATVAFDAPFAMLNADSASAAPLDAELAAAALGGFAAPGPDGALVADPGFGTAAVVSMSPFTVRFTVADGVRWSDGAPVDAVDLLLAWAAESGRFPAFRLAPGAVGGPLAASSGTPTVSEDRKSLTVAFQTGIDPLDAFGPVLPAHVAVREALGDAAAPTPEHAKDALLDLVARDDRAGMARVAAFWNDGFALDAGPDVLLSDGPYRIDSVGDRTVGLAPNDRYVGDRPPGLASVRLVTLDAAGALQGVEVGVVDVASLTPSDAATTAVRATRPTVLSAPDAQRLVVQRRAAMRGVSAAPDGSGLLASLWAWRPGR